MDRREFLANTFQDTLKVCKEEFNAQIKNSRRNNMRYYDSCYISLEGLEDKGDNVEVWDSDTLDAVAKLYDNGAEEGKICALNMASIKCPGGGVIRGARAQEETLCRKSTLYPNIMSMKDTYPIYHYNDAIYSKDIIVFKDSKYNRIEKPFKVNIITMAALKRPILTDGKLSSKDENIMYKKIKQMLSVIADNGNKYAVLGAFGCGAYRCPSEDVSKLFRKALYEEHMKDLFDKVIFAIIDDHNAIRENNLGGNYNVFKNVFEK